MAELESSQKGWGEGAASSQALGRCRKVGVVVGGAGFLAKIYAACSFYTFLYASARVRYGMMSTGRIL